MISDSEAVKVQFEQHETNAHIMYYSMINIIYIIYVFGYKPSVEPIGTRTK